MVRAGSHGKDFSIVVDEVRKLAEQTVRSTPMITSLVQPIHLDSKELVYMMDGVLFTVDRGVTVTEQMANYTEKVSRDAAVLTSFSKVNASSSKHIVKLTKG